MKEIREISELIREYVLSQQSGRIQGVVSHLLGSGYAHRGARDLRIITRNELENMQFEGLVVTEGEVYRTTG